MRKKRRRSRKRIIQVYIARTIVALILLIMVVLMFCGCLYIRDLFRKDETSNNKPKVEADADKEKDIEKDTSNDSEDEPDLPYAGYSVVLDPGHGGIDGGTMSDDELIVEKDINLAIATEIQALLKAQGIKVILTRDDDSFPSLDDRVVIANKSSADLFVSLHCNYFEDDSSVDGFEAFYCPNAAGSKKFAESIADAARQRDEIAVRGATENSYYVTKHSKMDAILIEMGFLSNATEAQKLASSDYQKTLAEAIVDGILQGFDNENVTDGGVIENEESSM